jgi:hypothetical protein
MKRIRTSSLSIRLFDIPVAASKENYISMLESGGNTKYSCSAANQILYSDTSVNFGVKLLNMNAVQYLHFKL